MEIIVNYNRKKLLNIFNKWLDVIIKWWEEKFNGLCLN